MKTIVLMPVKNEEWILAKTLETLSAFADRIIVADQGSTDGTRETCGTFPKVTVIENQEAGHSNKVRWLLLDEARKIEGDNLIFCIDADEMISPISAEKIKAAATETGPGSVFSLPWIQLWKGTELYRVDGVWKDSFKPCAFYDSRETDYDRQEVINDHTARVPVGPNGVMRKMPDCPLLHFQFAAWNRNQIKQAWYRCAELVSDPEAAKRINRKYSSSLDSERIMTMPVPKDWLKDVKVPDQENLASSDESRLAEIQNWIRQYSASYFEPLEIWHIAELHQVFIDTMKREPVPKTYPVWLGRLADARNALARLIKKA